MSGHSTDHPSLTKLHKFLQSDKACELGCRSIDHPCKTHFTSYKVLKRHVAHQVPDILTALYGSSDPGRMPNANLICTDYLITFVILLSIGLGRDIEFFVHHEPLADIHLPHIEKPKHWPFTRNEDDFRRFRDKQWRFLPAKFRLNMDVQYDESFILPIIEKENVDDGGGTAIVRRIVIHDDYNELEGYSSKNQVGCRSINSLVC